MRGLRGLTDREEFILLIAREVRTAGPHDLVELMRLSKRHKRLQERACNEQVPEGHDARCEGQIRAVCKLMGCDVIFSGDPRGATVKILVPSGNSNSWGGAGICIPQ